MVIAIFLKEGSVVSIGIVVCYTFRRESMIIGLKTSFGLKSQRLIKYIVLYNRCKNL